MSRSAAGAINKFNNVVMVHKVKCHREADAKALKRHGHKKLSIVVERK